MTRTILFIICVVFTLQSHALLASDAIGPYLKSGESGQFRYAIYNNRWLMVGLQNEKEKDKKRVAITSVSAEAEGELELPTEIEGLEVYGIDERAFSQCTLVTRIVIPKSVRFLRPGTLNNCRGLKEIVVAEDHPDFSSVDGALFDKQGEKLLAVPVGVSGEYSITDNTKEIGQFALSKCVDIKSVIVPDTVTDIGGRSGGAFLGCAGLEQIEIPDTVTNIGQKSFQECRSLRQVTIPPKVTAIPFGLFWRCDSLKEVTMPNGITSVGNYAFADCTELQLERFPNKLTKIGAYAFKNCKQLKLIAPKSITTIDRGAFNGTEIKLEEEGEIWHEIGED